MHLIDPLVLEFLMGCLAAAAARTDRGVRWGRIALWAGIAALARQCRFHDCAHAGEPGCAVSAALKTGELEPARWASYQKLLAEALYHERSVDQRAAAETKRKWKVLNKAIRHHPKYN